MKVLMVMILWGILLLLCWPLAVLIVLLWPIVWLLSIPFKVVGIAMNAVLALVKTILFMPARLLGYKIRG
ncbi:MAG: hypothetical protein LLF76_13380 [Planctomycetaceae bacterium]|nr:hypothetical protein [Planctomycetaceae bacterium]